MTLQERYRGAMMGLAVGDALGVPAEFQPRGTFPKITEMIGGGPFYLQPGEWTDDTSMALCLAQSLIEKDGFDAKDQMDKYWKWVEEGYMSSNGRMFDIGNQTSEALCRYRKNGNPFAGGNRDSDKSGNGSLMRLAPIPLFFNNSNKLEFIDYAVRSSELTHGSLNCICSCIFLSGLIAGALNGATKEQLVGQFPDSWWFFPTKSRPILGDDVTRIALGSYKNKTEDQIQSTGYVIHTLEAALWCFYNTTTFEDGLIKAVNLGDDSDTTGAVFGQLAGAYYGIAAIPQRWLDKIVKSDIIISVADKLYEKRK